MYLKHINNLPKKSRIILSVIFWLLTGLTISLAISAIVDDGSNAFALLFHKTELIKQTNPSYESVIQFAKVNNASPEFIAGLELLIPKEITITTSSQNSDLLAAVALLLFAFSYIFIIHASLINTISYSILNKLHIQAEEDNLITNEQFKVVDGVFKLAKAENLALKKNQNIETLKQLIKKTEESTEIEEINE